MIARRTLILGLLFFAAYAVAAQEAEVVYVEGIADIRTNDGEKYGANFGDSLYGGDSILTASDGRVELERADRSVIRISPDTIFTVREVAESGERSTVYATEVGAAFFRFAAMSGREPRISTPTTAAGVRGTAFSVFAGVDGSALYVVEEGAVEVSASGSMVALGPGEGVEVEPGSPPGAKFEVKRGEIDYSEWNASRLDAMLEDPVSAIAGVARRMDEFAESIRQLSAGYEENRDEVDRQRKILEEIEQEKGKDARSNYYGEIVFPLEVETSYQRLNLRYYALSALSLRRYVMAGMYIRVKPRYIGNSEAEEYREFLLIYHEAVRRFESSVTPYLVDADY